MALWATKLMRGRCSQMTKVLTGDQLLSKLTTALDNVERSAVFYLQTGDNNHFKACQFSKSDVLYEVKKLQEQNLRYREILARNLAFIQDIQSLYGQGLEVANLHLNGDLVPLDELINGVDEALRETKQALKAVE